ncbi:hypothetical protein CKO09_05165 [Chromatium weissei]|nr:hypothetical protein [Chromatium weissei]
MPLQSSTDADATARLFRARVFKPTEGVFLFHPRAMERLITEHLQTTGYEGSVPDLSYYLMPAAAFLSGLESENPEALAVIEGLNLPSQVILLPMPVEQRLDPAEFTRLLRDYWARRFEGEIARAWQAVCDLQQNAATTTLHTLIGVAAVAEIRDVLGRDNIIPAGLSDALVCRGFVALVTRLRYFSPGVRGCWFPAIHDWAALDQWMHDSGLNQPLAELLQRIQPDSHCGDSAHLLPLPPDLPYSQSDPDVRTRPAPRVSFNAPSPIEFAPATRCDQPCTPCPINRAPCLAIRALTVSNQTTTLRWREQLGHWLLIVFAPLLDGLLALPRPFELPRSTSLMLANFRLELALLLFRHAAHRAQLAERSGRLATVIEQFAIAQRRFTRIGEPCIHAAPERSQMLVHRRVAAESALAALLAEKWALDPHSAQELSQLVRHLSADILVSSRAWTARALLRDLGRVLIESRTTYYYLRPLAWMLSFGQQPLRQVLPFQANLKALRALDAGLTRLEQLGWATSAVERFHQPLQRLARRFTVHLEKQLKPHLQRAIADAGFSASNHREAVAAHKLLRELLDVIEHRRHLKFTDVRDIVARNVLRLPDFSANDVFRGDRLARFDRSAARALPGVYKPGEFYLKGLQQLGAPLFGTALGRLALRYLILPFGLAFLGLKTLHVLISLLIHHNLDLTPLWLVIVVGLMLNVIIHAHVVRTVALATLRGVWWGLRLLFYDSLRRLLRWPPLLRLLETSLVRGLDRHLLRPFVIGVFLVLPVIVIASVIEGALIQLNFFQFALALALGTLVRNTPAGRHLLDDTASGVGRFVRIVNQTLILGLLRELMQFFKEFTRRFQQGLHWIEELLSHRHGESRWALVFKALLIPVWRLLDALIQFYVTVLVEPQVNPIKHFPLVTIGHKVMLPFFPVITSFLLTVTASLLPKWIAYPLVTLTVLLLPGLAGFLVWELKENWKLYAANHSQPELPTPTANQSLRQVQAIELAIIGNHGETMRGLLRRGFHSGTLPKAFDRLRRVLRNQIRTETELPQRLRDARRHLMEIERAICVFCDRELAYALRRRCQQPDCGLGRIETQRPRLATASFELTLELYCKTPEPSQPIALHLSFYLLEPDLFLTVSMRGSRINLDARCWQRIHEDLRVFSGRAGARLEIIN